MDKTRKTGDEIHTSDRISRQNNGRSAISMFKSAKSLKYRFKYRFAFLYDCAVTIQMQVTNTLKNKLTMHIDNT